MSEWYKDNIKLKPVFKTDIVALLDFELENCHWFEQFVPARSEQFLTHIGMNEAVATLISEMEAKQGAYYLAFLHDKVIGRFNFYCGDTDCADLGYRVQENMGVGVLHQVRLENFCLRLKNCSIYLI